MVAAAGLEISCKRWLLLLLAALLLGAHVTPLRAQDAALSCVGAEHQAGLDTTSQLRLALRFVPSQTVTEALDSSIALHFQIILDSDKGRAVQHVTLSRDALLGRYTLTHAERTAQFRLRAELFDALGNTLLFPDARGIKRLRIQLLLSELPAPLRLPAFFDPDWHIDSGWCVMQHESDA